MLAPVSNMTNFQSEVAPTPEKQMAVRRKQTVKLETQAYPIQNLGKNMSFKPVNISSRQITKAKFSRSTS